MEYCAGTEKYTRNEINTIYREKEAAITLLPYIHYIYVISKRLVIDSHCVMAEINYIR